MQKQFLLIFLKINLPAGTLSLVLKIYFFAKILCENFILQACYSPLNTLWEKGRIHGQIRIHTSV